MINLIQLNENRIRRQNCIANLKKAKTIELYLNTNGEKIKEEEKERLCAYATALRDIYEEELQKLDAECKHELSIYIGKEKNDDLKCTAVCLECGRTFDMFNYDDAFAIDIPGMIEIEGIISKDLASQYVGEDNVLVKRALEKIEDLGYHNAYMSKEDLKESIKEDLVGYADELEESKVIPRKRKRF